VLEAHDTTGFGEDGAAASLDEAVTYWISQKAALVGQENYIVINIGNEPIGNNNASQWTAATTAAIQRMRANGFEHLLMVDAPNWGQDWQFVMRDNAQTVLNADTQHNTVLSIHMYSVFNTASSITSYLDTFQNNGWPLVIGEFGWQFQSGEVDHETLLAQADARGLGYIGWSWSGNTDPILDLTLNFDRQQLSSWGKRVFNGQGRCADCHMPPLYTDAGYNAHKPAEICTDSFQADRGPEGGTYVTPQLEGLWARSKRGFYHDGRHATLGAVVDHYNSCFGLNLSARQRSDLVQYLKSL